MKNEPAFPLHVAVGPAGDMHDSSNILGGSGLTKLEYAAIEAMKGILSNHNYEPPRRDKLTGMAEDAMRAAREILAHLEREQSEEELS
jgi:hypothetical protein